MGRLHPLELSFLLKLKTEISTKLHPHEYAKKTYNKQKLAPTNLNGRMVIRKAHFSFHIRRAENQHFPPIEWHT